jgi:UDP-glucose 4-epimerase
MGTDYPTPDGTAVRDYVHITDLADAHLLTLRYLLEGGDSDIFNLGTGQGRSVRDVVATAERLSGSQHIARNAPRRPGDPPYLVADSRKATSTLGWQPKRSDLDTIVGTALAWHRAEPMRSRKIAATSTGS